MICQQRLTIIHQEDQIQRLKLIGPSTSGTNIEFTGSAKFDTDVTIGDDLTVNDFALINAARIGSTPSDPGDGVLITEDYGAFLGGVHVGGTSDPGTNNLLVDGTLTVDGLVTLGDSNTDTVIISGSNFTLPNLTNVSTPATGDKILTLDADTNKVQTTGQTDLPYIRVVDGVVPADSKILMFTGSSGTKEVTQATGIIYSSNLNPTLTKSEMILELCKKVGANKYISGPFGRNYLNIKEFDISGIKIDFHEVSLFLKISKIFRKN